MKRHVVIVAAVTLALLLVNIDLTIVNIAIPVLSREFGVPVDTSVLVIISYLLAMVGTLLIFGRLNDMGYANHLFKLGFWVFMVSSALCALSWNLPSLLFFRFIQGIGSAMFLSTYAIIIKDNVPDNHLGKAYGVVGIAAGAGYTAGLFLGGLILTYFSWRMIFLINIPICLAGAVSAHLLLEKRPYRAVTPASFDVKGAVLGFLSFVCLVFSLHLAYEDNTFHPDAAWWFAGAVLLLATFVHSQKTSAAPLLNLAILKNRAVVLILISTACVLAVENTGCLLLPLYFVEAMEFSLVKTSHLLIVLAVATFAFSPPAGWLVDRYGARTVSLVGAVTFCGATGMLATFGIHTSTAFIVTVLLLFGIILTLFSAAIMTYLMQHATPESTGVITSLKSLLPIIFTMIATIIYGGMYTYFKLNVSGSPAVKAQTAFRNDMLLSLGIAIVSVVLLACIPKDRPLASEPEAGK